MIYRSNLAAPDLTLQFRYIHSRVMGHSFGHDVLSDWADKSDSDPVFGLYKTGCGFWTHDEAAILYTIAHAIGGRWADIGSHTGWTAAHIAGGAVLVAMVDPLYAVEEFRNRAVANMRYSGGTAWYLEPKTAKTFFAGNPLLVNELGKFDGIVIDGDHEPGEPLNDAIAAAEHLKERGVILFHDFVGLPVREAVLYLITEKEMNVKLYLTPHVVACCWRSTATDRFMPPVHVPDPAIKALRLFERWQELNWEKYL
jgi:hypothetical protein